MIIEIFKTITSGFKIAGEDVEGKLNLANGDNKEGPSSASLDNNCNEFWVDCTEGTVPGDAGHADVIDAVLAFPHLGKDVAELALSDHTSSERHFSDGK